MSSSQGATNLQNNGIQPSANSAQNLRMNFQKFQNQKSTQQIPNEANSQSQHLINQNTNHVNSAMLIQQNSQI